MEWKKFEIEIPEKNSLVIVFQYKRRRYIVARLGLYIPKGHQYDGLRIKEPIDANTYTTGTPRWFSESGNRLEIHNKDMWSYLEPVTITEVFK